MRNHRNLATNSFDLPASKMDLPASLKNLREFFSKHKFIYFISLFFFYLIIFHYLFALLDSLGGFLARMNARWLFSLYPISSSFLVTATTYIRIALEIELLVVFAISIASLLKSTIQILLSDTAEKGTELSFKDTLSRVTESVKCLLFTWFYVRFLKLGYIFVGILVFLPQLLNIKIQDLSDLSAFCETNTILVVLAILGTVLYLYLAVVWNLALVVSLCEDKSGIEAFRRAAELAEEMKLKLTGLCLNIVFGISNLTIFVLHNEDVASTNRPVTDVTKILFVAVIANEVSIWLCYRSLHLKCKKNHEAAIQLDVSLEHKISPQCEPLIGELV